MRWICRNTLQTTALLLSLLQQLPNRFTAYCLIPSPLMCEMIFSCPLTLYSTGTVLCSTVQIFNSVQRPWKGDLLPSSTFYMKPHPSFWSWWSIKVKLCDLYTQETLELTNMTSWKTGHCRFMFKVTVHNELCIQLSLKVDIYQWSEVKAHSKIWVDLWLAQWRQ